VRKSVARLAGVLLLFVSTKAWAQAAPPAHHAEEAFDFMNLMAHQGLHELTDESWNAYGQYTYISSWKLPFSAPYTNANGSVNSLVPDAERSFTSSFTLFFGARLWKGGEVYFVPEAIAERGLSNLRGIGGSIQNFELQKTGSETPQLYRSRTYLRQTFDLGGEPQEKTSDPMQLATVVDSRRIVLWGGTFTALDVFDRWTTIPSDPRRSFLNMAFMTHSAWDFAADARGYSFGGAAELYWDDWAMRVGRMAPPQDPNVLALDYAIDKHYADSFELEHDHTLFGLEGAVRFLAYRNREVTGRFDEAIAALRDDPTKNAAACTGYNYGSHNVTAPDLCWVRRPNTKVGVGINVEQHVTKDVGVFFKAMVSDGRTEVDAFDPADRSLSFGALARGPAWKRDLDVAGVGFAASFISDIHAQYLAMGGVDGFVGDGHLTPAAETVVDVFYSLNLFKALWLTADYQHMWNPGFNADRGNLHILGGRVHAEF
jgi:hypothetical protein